MALYTANLTYMVGYLAIKKSMDTVLSCLIISMSVAILITIFHEKTVEILAGCRFKCCGKNDKSQNNRRNSKNQLNESQTSEKVSEKSASKKSKDEKEISDFVGKTSKTFKLLGFILSLAILVALFSGEGIFRSFAFGVVTFILMFFYYLLDTLAIVSKKYSTKIDADDHVYACVKLFTDFILCFTILMSLCTSGDN